MKFLLLFFVLTTSCCLKESYKSSKITIMSWNVQNLFDGQDDGVEYDEFSIANGSWSNYLYNIRLKNISKIIELNKPDIVALQEIEGEAVLIDLCSFLKGYSYYTSTNVSGPIQLGFISKYPILTTGLIKPYSKSGTLRPLLEVAFNVEGFELVIINNHWKSKIGTYSENMRISSAVSLKKRVSELGSKEVVIVGDFNENHNEYQRVHKSYETGLMFLAEGAGVTITDSKPKSNELFTVWPDSNYPGSYIYKNEWESIDHFLLNSNIMDNKGFSFSRFMVDNRAILLNKNGGIKKWVTGYRSGYSDHLPIILELEIEGVDTTLY